MTSRIAIFSGLAMLLTACGPNAGTAGIPDDTTPPAAVVESTTAPRDPAEPLVVPGPLNDDAVSVMVGSYLPKHLLATTLGGTSFCAYDIYGWDQGDQIANVWLWALCEEHYLSGGDLATGSGVSTPVALQLSQSAAGWTVSDHATPEDGSLYTDSLRELFPAEYAERALEPGPIDHLKDRVEHAARSQLAS